MELSWKPEMKECPNYEERDWHSPAPQSVWMLPTMVAFEDSRFKVRWTCSHGHRCEAGQCWFSNRARSDTRVLKGTEI